MPAIDVAHQHLITARALHQAKQAEGKDTYDILDWSGIVAGTRVAAGLDGFSTVSREVLHKTPHAYRNYLTAIRRCERRLTGTVSELMYYFCKPVYVASYIRGNVVQLLGNGMNCTVCFLSIHAPVFPPRIPFRILRPSEG